MKKVFLSSYLLLSVFFSGYSQSLLTDLRLGMDSSEPALDAAFQKDDDLYFVASPDGMSSFLYKTDGTTGNTVVIEGGGNLFVSMVLGVLGDDILYLAGDVAHGEGLALYKTNGTPQAGQFIIDYNQNNDLFIAYPMHIVKNGVLYFFGAEPNTGFELWRTDGTASGTYLVKDIYPGMQSSIVNTEYTQYFGELNGEIYFGAAEPVYGAELWKSDGTESGTVMVADIDTTTPQIANFGSNPAYFCKYNNAVYFSAYRPVDGRELWKTDGTSAGTTLVKDISEGSSGPSKMTEYNGSLYFTAHYPNQNYTVFKSNGTGVGTNALKQPDNGGPVKNPASSFVVFKNKLFFNADNDQGYNQIWYTDGTEVGTGFLPNTTFYGSTDNLLATTNFLYFTANINLSDYNVGVFRTTEFSNQITLLTNQSFSANANHPLFLVNDCILVRGDEGTVGEEIYTICNQNTNPLNISELISNNQLTVFPNPCVDRITVESNFKTDEITAVQLIDLFGKTQNLSFTNNNHHSFSIDGLSEFSSGIYHLVIEMNNGQKQQVKFVVR